MAGIAGTSGGLTKRRNVANYQDSRPMTEEDDEKKYADPKSRSDDEEDLDAKDMRLTLMEEVLLLGLKDREVSSSEDRCRSGG